MASSSASAGFCGGAEAGSKARANRSLVVLLLLELLVLVLVPPERNAALLLLAAGAPKRDRELPPDVLLFLPGLAAAIMRFTNPCQLDCLSSAGFPEV
jgi:hypothetical protein